VKRRTVLWAGASLAFLAATETAFAQDASVPAGYPAGYAEIIEGSKAEGRLLIYGNMSASAWAGAKAGFNKLYPWIELEDLDIESAELIERYLAEKGTGSRTADVLVSNAMEGWLNLIERKEILDYASPEAPAIPDVGKPSPGLYAIAVDSEILFWNKPLLGEDLVPESVADLAEKIKANPGMFNGRIATYAPDSSAIGLQSHYALVEKHGDKTWEWLDVIAPNVRGERSNGPMLEKVISGEYLLAYHSLPGNVWIAMKKPELQQIVGWKFLNDGTFLNLRGSAITKSATNVNSAKLFMDYLLSKEGQIALATGGRTPIRSDVMPEDVNGAFTYGSVQQTVGADTIMTVPYDRSFTEGREAFLARWKQATSN
jgi:iron(III) transport system substrate-binding protein